MPKDIIFEKNVKRFLNDDPHEYGTVCYNVDVSRWHPDDIEEENEHPSLYHLVSTVRLQDCYETICLEFSISDKHSTLDKRLDKLNTLIHTLQELKIDIIDSSEKMDERNAKLKADGKEESEDGK